MRKILLMLLMNVIVTLLVAQTTIVTTNFAFSPSEVTITQGQSVQFTTSGIHNVREVSQATWDAGDNTSNGGFTVGTNTTQSVTFNQAGTYYFVCPPHASIGMKGKINVLVASGVLEEKLISELSVYPNPTRGDAIVEFTITKPGRVNISLLNTIGKKIEGSSISKDYPAGKHVAPLNTSGLPSGLYFVEIVTNGSRTIQKLFVID